MVSVVCRDPDDFPGSWQNVWLFACPARWREWFRFSILDTWVDYSVFVLNAQLNCLIWRSIRSTTSCVRVPGQSWQACVACSSRVSSRFNCVMCAWWLVWFLGRATRFCCSVLWWCVAWCNECAELFVSMLPLLLLVKRTAQIVLFVMARQIHQQHDRNSNCG